VGGEADDGGGSEDATGEGGGDVELADVDAVCFDLEGEVGSVVEHEGNVMGATDLGGEAAALDDVARLEGFVPELDDVHSSCDA
jgi:hypothetical protein